MHKLRKFKNYLLFPRIQARFIIYSLLSILMIVGITFYQIHSSFEYLMDIGQKMQIPSESGYFKLLKAQEEILSYRVFGAFVLGGLFSVLINIFITHRTLGPFYRIKQFFAHYRPDEKKEIRFRKSDYFKDLENDINNALHESQAQDLKPD